MLYNLKNKGDERMKKCPICKSAMQVIVKEEIETSYDIAKNGTLRLHDSDTCQTIYFQCTDDDCYKRFELDDTSIIVENRMVLTSLHYHCTYDDVKLKEVELIEVNK